MLIGIAGKIGTGKDEIAKIILSSYIPGMSVHKYADGLKDIVCLLIGCTREDLEDREFKETELGEEWDSISCYDVGWDKDWSAQEPSFDTTKPIIKMTPRRMLQLLGTECGRQIIHPNIWCNMLMKEYDKKQIKWTPDGPTYVEHKKNWIITDVRFPNEAKAITDRGGIVIKVVRDTSSKDLHESETALNNYKFDYIIDNNGNLDDLNIKVGLMLKNFEL